MVVVAHKILVTSPEAKFLFPFLGLWALDWDLASGLSIIRIKIQRYMKSSYSASTLGYLMARRFIVII